MTSQNRSLESLNFDNRFVRDLPCDPDPANQRRQVTAACYSKVKPAHVKTPALAAYSVEVAQMLGLDPDDFTSPQFQARFAQVFSGNELLTGMDPYAMCYGGHQFGNWAGQLGDGRAINLGEVVNSGGDRWALQLKGSGQTPYSRGGDGLAVLRSSVREFLCSEAMFHLGVPTTRALSLVTTGEQVMRDMFYDGNAKFEPGAIVCRVAPSFTRFGNFQIFASRGDNETLTKLLDFTIANDYPHLKDVSAENKTDAYVKMFHEVCIATSEMVVHWMRVGFVHGVMNTDNMSILGLTIDYGPYGWLEDFDPMWTPNTTDAQGRRYCFGNQPGIAQWNLLQLANALYPVIGDAKPLQEGLEIAAATYKTQWQNMMAKKLGLKSFDESTDEELTDRLAEILQLAETDMTIFYRRLANVSAAEPAASSDEELVDVLLDAYYATDQLTVDIKKQIGDWVRSYQTRLAADPIPDDQRRRNMNSVNPNYVLRNYLAQLAIDKAETGDHSMIGELLEVMRNPYDEQPGKETFAAKRPEWARNRPGCSTLSCSS
jgi:uncharacterized protein YdiU (UPF0061 family)